MHLSHFYNQLLTICPPVPALSLHTAGAFFLWQGPTIIIKTDLIHKYLHLKSEDPAARRTLLGCQSRLRMVERIGFLMCLHTHLTDKKPKTNGFPIKVKTSSLCTLETDIWLTLTSHFLARSNRWRWGESRCPLQTCSLVATTWRSEQRGWSWGWPEWASMRPPSGSTHRHYGLPRRWRCGYCQEPSQHLLRCKDRRWCLVCCRSYQLINYSYLRDKKSEKASRVKILLLQKLSCLHFCVMLSYASVATAQFN